MENPSEIEVKEEKEKQEKKTVKFVETPAEEISTESSHGSVAQNPITVVDGSVPKTGRERERTNELDEAEEKAVSQSADGRFLKFDIVLGRGSFKTVYKGLDTETGVAVAWCELQVCFSLQLNFKFIEHKEILTQMLYFSRY